jgi:hypothetical protein
MVSSLPLWLTPFFLPDPVGLNINTAAVGAPTALQIVLSDAAARHAVNVPHVKIEECGKGTANKKNRDNEPSCPG